MLTLLQERTGARSGMTGNALPRPNALLRRACVPIACADEAERPSTTAAPAFHQRGGSPPLNAPAC
ncbi:hypothetical protein ACDH70_19330 [Xanthomonas axonopodis pv. poinsettiicola]|uniref:hypothetical protein n=1 Tax=Xanthomonas TaxID=338 RepID=UPI001E2E8C1D|nr:hypothetical protein [Xanthomonas codiaei]MCC8536357.1 hypothetical protein [Xanthomonas codiaei]